MTTEAPADCAVIAGCYGVMLACFGAPWWVAGLASGAVLAIALWVRRWD